MKLGKVCGFFFISLLLIAGCQTTPDPEFKESFFALAKEQGSIQCELSTMQDTIAAKWDQMGQTLVQHLPDDMPEVEKRNMIAVRNADLIRMFQSYETLAYSIKMELAEVEKEDSMMVVKIRDLNIALKELEQERMEKMSALQQNFPEVTTSWTIRYDSILQNQCATF